MDLHYILICISLSVGLKSQWSTSETSAVIVHLSSFLRLGKTPKKEDCEKCLANAGNILQTRTWSDIKNHVYNLNIKKKKKFN